MKKIYFKEKYFGIPKKFILSLIIIGVVFAIYGLAKITIFAPKIVADRTGQYIFKTVNIKDFKAGFGIQRETPNIVFQRNGTEIIIELPSKNMTWQKIKKGVQAQSQEYAYEYSILKDEKGKAVGIKEEIVLEQPLSLSHFVFPITLKNLEPKEIENVWHFFNVSGRDQFYIPALFMEDANGERSEEVKIEVNTAGGFIKITPSRQWLDDIERVYPIIIDPSIRIYQETEEEKDLPNIVNAYVDPIKVVPGDTMFVYAEIMDPHGVSQVIADMGGIETINLELKQGTIHNGTWQAEWLVHDTGPREYTTIITATNKIGKSSSASIVWLDPSWLAGWDNRIKFTIDNTKVDDDLSHFPVTVFLDSTQGEEVFTEFDADADYLKVAFTKDDGVAELYAEKEFFQIGYTSEYPPAQSDTYVKATTIYDADHYAHFTTDPTKSLTGTYYGTTWQSGVGIDTNQRFHIDLGSAKVIKRIYYENMHNSGDETDRGVQNFTFWGSNTGAGTFDDLVYVNDEGWTQITTATSSFDRHVAADQADPKYITVTNSTAYRYYAFKFADNYGSAASLISIRRIELQTEQKGIYHISKTGWEISSSTDTDFYMYYDNDHADNTDYIGAINTTAGANVWDANFKMVQHMVDDTTSAIKDSTSNNNDGTKLSADNPIEATGKIGQGQDFSDDYISFADSADWYFSGDFSIDLLVNFDVATNGIRYNLVSQYSDGETYFAFRREANDKLEVIFYNTNVAVGEFATTDVWRPTVGTWYHVAFVRSGATAYIYINGASVGVTEVTTWGTIPNVVADLWMGAWAGTPYYLDGKMDETHITQSVRSASYIKATYNSALDTLLTYGDEEEYVHPVPADFAHRIKLTIDNTKVDSTLTHFPVTVILSSTHGDSVFDELTSDANRFKIAFTKADGSTQLYGEIEKWDDANESAVIHVSKTGWEISSTADTDFYMYYDSSLNDNFAYIGDIASTPGESVWDSNFKMVQHMTDDTTSAIKDSTSNNNDGTKKGANEPVSIAGKVGLAQDFSSDYITHATFLDVMPDDLTCEAIIKLDIVDTDHYIFYKKNISGEDLMGFYIHNTNQVRFWGEAQGGGPKAVQGTDTVTTATWYYVAGVHTHDSALKAYLNTTEYTGDTLGNILDGTNTDIFVGASDAVPNNPFDGIIDELRFSSTPRAAAWLKATYNTLWDTLLTYGAQEDNTAPTAPNTLYSNNANAQAGKENPTGITDTTPVFSAVYNDPDAGDIANKYRIQVATSSDFATSSVFWDSGSSGISMSNCVQGDRCQDIAYASTTVLALDITKYYWRIKFWDGGTGWDGSEEGAWSTETAHFTMAYRELDTSTNANTLRLGADRHTFYDGTYYWAFYIDDNSHIVYEKSSDGTTWDGTVTEIATSTTYTSLGIWEDDIYIWTAYNSTTTSYTKKIKISDGALGAEYSTSTPDRYHPQIIKDSAGYLWRKEEEEGSTSVELDYMEYANDAAAQAEYVSNDSWNLLNEDCSDISDWTDEDTGTAVSEVDPAGQFRLDTNLGADSNAIASLYRTITSPPDKFVIEAKTYFDKIGVLNAPDYSQIAYFTTSWLFLARFASDGLFIYKAAGNTEVGTDIVKHGGSAAWQTWRFEVDKSGGEAAATVEVFLDNVSQGTFDSDYETPGTDGKFGLSVAGYITDNMVTHYDYIKIGELNLQSYSESTIKQQGSYSLKGVAKATDSLNDTLTRTIGSPIDLTAKDIIYFDARASRTGSNIKIGIHDSGGATTEITPNITQADTFQTVTWDISGVANANKDVIDSIIITIVNADANNTFYIDNMYGEGSEITYYARQSTSVNDDSAWQAETEIGRDSSGFGHMSLTHMGSGKVMALFNDYDSTNYNLKYRIYDSSWGASSTVVTDCKDNTSYADWDEYHWFSAVADSSNNIHVVYVDSDDNDLNYIYYNGSSWSSAQEIYTGTVTHPSLSYDSTTGNLVAFFIEGNAIKYKVKNSGSWGDPSGGAVVKTGLDSPTYLGSAYSDATSIGIIWKERSSSPYAISYAVLTLTEARSDIIRIKGGTRLKGGLRLK